MLNTVQFSFLAFFHSPLDILTCFLQLYKPALSTNHNFLWPLLMRFWSGTLVDHCKWNHVLQLETDFIRSHEDSKFSLGMQMLSVKIIEIDLSAVTVSHHLKFLRSHGYGHEMGSLEVTLKISCSKWNYLG